MSRPDPSNLDQRNPAVIASVFPYFSLLYDKYFRCEIDGIENIPEEGPAIIFGNHSGSTYTLEAGMLAVGLMRRYGFDHPLYILCHKAFFDVPKLRQWFLDFGCVLASREVATKVLRGGGQFVVFPGGDRDSHKPFSQRHQVNFFGHTGFIRMSMTERVPLVPFAHVGTHETLFVLSRGERIAKLLHLKKLTGLAVFPLVLSFPFGLSLGPVFPALPLPSKFSMKLLPEVRLWELGWDDPENPRHVEESLAYLTREVQGAVDALARGRRRPILG